MSNIVVVTSTHSGLSGGPAGSHSGSPCGGGDSLLFNSDISSPRASRVHIGHGWSRVVKPIRHLRVGGSGLWVVWWGGEIGVL